MSDAEWGSFSTTCEEAIFRRGSNFLRVLFPEGACTHVTSCPAIRGPAKSVVAPRSSPRRSTDMTFLVCIQNAFQSREYRVACKQQKRSCAKSGTEKCERGEILFGKESCSVDVTRVRHITILISQGSLVGRGCRGFGPRRYGLGLAS